MSAAPQHVAQNKPTGAPGRGTGTVLRRTCACGTHTGGGECESCRKKPEGQLQRRASPHAPASTLDQSTAPPIVHDVLGSLGRPLDRDTRTFMESRFGHDFSGVRVHTDDRAAASASAVRAEAYTVGRDIVFGRGYYAPSTSSGRRLLAHELTHVVQQRESVAPRSGALQIGSATDHSEREAEQAADVVTAGGTQARGMVRPPVLADTAVAAPLRRRNIFDAIAGLFKGDSFSEADLQAYLKHLDATGKIEDFNESDNKARAIVNAWRVGGSPYVLTAQRKILLIKEMQSGFTGDDDEQAILEILERSYTAELGPIFAAIGVEDLNSDFHGAEWKQLQDFYSRRFEGGMEAMLKGQIVPTGSPVRLGASLTTTNGVREPLPGATLDAMRPWDMACVLGILCSQDKAVIHQLPRLTVKVADNIYFDDPIYDGTQWTVARFDAAGYSSAARKQIGVRSDVGCAGMASTIVHEVRHQNQPAGLSVFTREVDAYTWTEQWAIDRGFPGNPLYRIRDTRTGRTVPYKTEIEADVCATYPSACGEIVTGRTPAGESQVRRLDGTTYTRPPKQGDKYSGELVVQRERTIDPAGWKCPDTKQA